MNMANVKVKLERFSETSFFIEADEEKSLKEITRYFRGLSHKLFNFKFYALLRKKILFQTIFSSSSKVTRSLRVF